VSKPRGAARTNAARILDELGVAHETISADVPEDDLSAETAAALLGLPENMVYKTLVLKGDRTGHLEALLPAGRELDLKGLASASGDRSVELIPVKALFDLTGYRRGGCSPLGGRRKLPVWIHDDVLKLDKVAVNAGARGVMLILSPQDLVKAVDAKTAPLARPPR
jgi:Cys-tRNA(Pro)/Cys-tRNA(Cys) deacylase